VYRDREETGPEGEGTGKEGNERQSKRLEGRKVKTPIPGVAGSSIRFLSKTEGGACRTLVELRFGAGNRKPVGEKYSGVRDGQTTTRRAHYLSGCAFPVSV